MRCLQTFWKCRNRTLITKPQVKGLFHIAYHEKAIRLHSQVDVFDHLDPFFVRKVDKTFELGVLPDLFTWKRGSKWTKNSVVEVSAGEKAGFYINAILKLQVTALPLFRKHQKISRQTSTTEKIVHFCLFLMQATIGVPLKGWIWLFIHTNTR